jgi:hypothetical protein
VYNGNNRRHAIADKNIAGDRSLINSKKKNAADRVKQPTASQRKPGKPAIKSIGLVTIWYPCQYLQ